MGTISRVFISYAHESDAHRQSMLNYSNWLNNPGGLDCWIDQYVEDSDMPEGWPHWMMGQIKAAKYVLVVCSQKYLARFERAPEEVGKGLGAKFESTLMLNDIYQNESLNIKFIPVINCPDDKKFIPGVLQSQSYYDLSSDERRDALYRRLTNQPLHTKPEPSKNIISMSSGKADSKKINEPLIEIIDVTIPEIKKIMEMKPGTKILQAFFGLPVTTRFKIAGELGLVESGESIKADTSDKLCATFLERAYQRNLLAQLWTKLFDESIDPNPFKK